MKEQKYEIRRKTVKVREEDEGHLVICHFAGVPCPSSDSCRGGLVNALSRHWQEATLNAGLL